MKRQALDNGTWFDREKATSWKEGSYFDGNNHVSLATGDKFTHEKLYRTARGRWVLFAWSQWQGSRETWTEITDADAARWLVRNEHDGHPACATEYAALELQ